MDLQEVKEKVSLLEYAKTNSGVKVVKHIRPLTAYKKINPESYKNIATYSDSEGLSKKQQENNFYWNYCLIKGGIRNLAEGKKGRDLENDPVIKFFWKDINTTNNKATITELGRLQLTGWYYNIEEFTKQVCNHVYNGHRKGHAENKNINDLEFAAAVKHIRDNVGYYYHNQDQVKIYLIEKLFSEDIKQYLPEPPEAVKEHEWIMEIINSERQRNLKKDKNFYIKYADDIENYSDYLTDLLDQYGIEYIGLEEYQEQTKQGTEEYWQEVEEAYNDYEEQKQAALMSSNLLT